ncbi:hypothetical protein EIP86_011245 [Pleurotus ostreatoroseus]|nr:hypothetical protein EIP86_011245 [Pleurotus ostreatoroseus]
MPRARSLRSLTISRRRTTSPGPPSPTFSETTNASAMNFGPDGPEKIVTRADLKASVQAYGDVRVFISCPNPRPLPRPSLKRLRSPAPRQMRRVQGRAHGHVARNRTLCGRYGDVRNERSNTYERALREKSRIIQQTERDNIHKKGRNLQTFREALAVLQQQVDDLDDLKVQHYQEIIVHEEEVWDVVQAKMCLLVRSTLDVFDRFTAKASDPVIEPMLQAVPDPFDSYGPQPAEDKIFSILPPLSVLANAPSASPSPITSSTPELESDGTTSGKSSWTTAGGFFPEGGAAWAQVAASPASSPPSSIMPGSMPASPPIASPSISPPVVSRRHSYPVAPTVVTHTHRKSESKLRSVLAVIDESRTCLNGDSAELASNGAPQTQEVGTSSATKSSPSPSSSSHSTPTPPPIKTPPAHSHSHSHPSPGSTLFAPAPSGVSRTLAMTDEVPWASTGLNLPSRPSTERGPSADDLTPRSSVFRPRSPASPSSPPPDTPIARRSRSPQSDDTAVPIS